MNPFKFITNHAQSASLVILGLLLSSICHAEHYKVYLLGGQSNASGRGDASELSAPYDSPQTDVALYWHKTLVTDNGNLTQDTWIDLQVGSGQGKNSPSGHAVEFGPELAFGRTMADADPSANVAIIKYGHGGSNLHTQWAKGGSMYQTFITTVSEALAALTDAGHTYELIGMFWQQGEADAGNATNANNYETNLTDLIGRVRTDVFGGLNLPFVIGGLSTNQYANMSFPETVRLAQETVAATVDGCGFSNADNCEVYASPNVIHFNYLGQLALGTAHAAEMIRLEGLDPDYDGLQDDQETALGTDPNNPDSDGDGQKDGFEFRAGTNPTNSSSLFKVTNIIVISNAVSLTWPSKSGNYYGVETSNDLSEWTDIEVDVPASAVESNTVWMSIPDEEVPSISNVLAWYDAQTGLNGDFNTTAFDSVDTDSSTTATRLIQGGSLTGGGSSSFVLANALFNTSTSGSPGFNLASVNTASQSAAALNGDWLSFTVESDGNTVTYESLSFYSDQFKTTGMLDVSYTISGSSETFILQNYVLPGNNASVELKGIDFADFYSGNEVVWTFYLYGAAASNYGSRLDDITLFGSSDTIVEEPAEPSSGFYRINLQ